MIVVGLISGSWILARSDTMGDGPVRAEALEETLGATT